MNDTRGAYEAWHAGLEADEGADAPWHRLVRDHLPLLAGCAVLEIGCGRGGFAAWLAAQGPATVVGADFSRTAIAKATAHGGAAIAAGGLRFVVADITTLGCASARFDVVVSCETVEHVADPRAAVCELARVLRPGGTLFLTTPNYLGPMGLFRAYRALTGRRYTEVGQPINRVTLLPRTVRWVRRAGLSVVSVEGVGHYLPVPRRTPLRLDARDRAPRPLRWFALHTLVVARRPG